MQAIKTLYALITIAAFAAVGCARETLNDDKIEGVTFGVSADESNVKSELNDKTLKWTESETMQLFYTTIGGSTWNAASSKQSSLVDGRVNFIFVLPYGTANTLKVKGVTPSTAVSGTDAKNCQITIPVRQQPSSTSYDPAAMIQVASSDSINVVAGWNGASFSPIVALNRLTLKGIDGDLITVEITCDQNFAGNATADLTGSQPLTGDARTITVGYPTPLVKGAAGHDVFFTSYGATTSSLTITAYTATKKYTKTITKQMTFAAGEYTWYSNVNMTDCGTDNEIVGECLFAAATWNTAESKVYLMKNDYSGYDTGKKKEEAISCSDFYHIIDIDNYKWTIAKEAFGYSIKNVADQKYIGTIPPDVTQLVKSDIAVTHQFSFPDSTIWITTNADRYINVNSGSFGAYTWHSSCPKLVKWVDDTRADRGLAYENPTIDGILGQQVSNNLAGVTSDGVYSSSNEEVATVDSESGVVTMVAPGTTTIKIVCPATDAYKPGAASYVLKVYPAEPTDVNGYYRVEHSSWIKSGDKVIIAAKENLVAMSIGYNESNKYCEQISADVTSEGLYKILTDASGIQKFIVCEGSKSSTFALRRNNGNFAGKYLSAASSSANQIKNADNIDDNSSFVIDVNEGSSIITAQGEYTKNIIKYNSEAVRFSCYASGQEDVSIYKLYGKETCYQPIINFSSPTVTISTETEGASIYYTVDGTDPTESSTPYSESFDLESTATVKAIAVKANFLNSAVAERYCELSLKCSTPSITILNGKVTIDCETTEATIRYTTDGTAPVDTSAIYSQPDSINFGDTVKAKAFKEGMTPSDIATGVYSTINFSFTSKVDGWPTSETGKDSTYIYSINSLPYSFHLTGKVYCSSGYLMVKENNKLGLPAISDKKLTKLVILNSSGCSVSTKVSVANEAGEVVEGGEQQTFATKSSNYTYSLSNTEANTRYYISVSSANCQIINIACTYE